MRTWALLAPLALVQRAMPGGAFVPAGRYDVAIHDVKISGYKTTKNGPTRVFCPVGNGTFKVVLYAFANPPNAADKWMSAVAETGLIVLQPPREGYVQMDMARDLLHAASVAQAQGAELLGCLGQADFTRVGTIGVSVGGGAAVQAALEGPEQNFTMGAVLCHAPAVKSKLGALHNLTLPLMFTTGTMDGLEAHTYTGFNASSGRPKILADLHGAGHMEPMDLKGAGHMAMNALGAAFLSCHLSGRQDHCRDIYGGGGEEDFCHNATAVKGTWKTCEIVGGPAALEAPPGLGLVV